MEQIVTLTRELRSPLTSIISYNELLLSQTAGAITDAQQQFLQRIHTNSQQLLKLIQKIVSVVTVDYGGLSLTPQRLNFENLLDDAVAASRSLYREKGVGASN